MDENENKENEYVSIHVHRDINKKWEGGEEKAKVQRTRIFEYYTLSIAVKNSVTLRAKRLEQKAYLTKITDV